MLFMPVRWNDPDPTGSQKPTEEPDFDTSDL